MRRLTPFTTLALAGILAATTGCEGTIDRLKANYAARQGNDAYKTNDFSRAIEWYRYANYLNPDLDLAYYHTALAYMAEYKPGSKHPKKFVSSHRYGTEKWGSLDSNQDLLVFS